ncbi:MAG TPA: ABC transporter ATP-binding protein [Chloroflexia bacterium]|nr:ABC transporter ATP-binding protein [Chloroflexia bacterium]
MKQERNGTQKLSDSKLNNQNSENKTKKVNSPKQDEQDELTGKAYDPRLARRFAVYLKPYSKQIILALSLVLGTSMADLVGPFLTKQAIDNYIAKGRANDLWQILLIYLLALLVGFSLRYGQTYLMQSVGQRVMYDLRMALFTHVERLSLSFFDKNPVGRLMSRLTSDVDALNELLSNGLVSMLGDVVTLGAVSVIMLLLDWRLALIMFATLPFVTFASIFFRRYMRESFRQVRSRLARINAFLQENVSGMLVVQLFNREGRAFNQFEGLNKSYYDATIRSAIAFALFSPIVGLLSALALAGLLWFGGHGVLDGWVSFGVLVAFFQYINRAFQPIQDLAEKYNMLQGAMASSERIFGLLDEQPVVVDPEKPVHFPRPFNGEIEFKNVNFSYVPDEPVLKNVSFTIPAGTSVAIVGATGAGKTSIISLMSRFYDVQQGQILVDGLDVREVAQAELRRHIGVVLQDPVLFSGTIASNIRLLDETISDEQVQAAARFVNASQFIERFEDVYDHEVKERGTNLSVGQRQLLAFARAIAFNPEVLLVLDEATSSVDTENEALIQEALEKLMEGRTSIIIAHRLSTIRHVDRIIVLHKGQIVETGTHDELLSRRGFYFRLYQLQYQDQEISR